MIFFAVILLLKCFSKDGKIDSSSKNSGTSSTTTADPKDLATKVDELGEELVDIREDTNKLSNNVYYTMNEAFEMREDALKLEFKTSILDTLSFLKKHATETASCLQEMRKSLDNVKGRLDDLESAVEANGQMAATIKSRQEVMMSEVRLISHHKMTNQSSILLAGGHEGQLAVDGQFVFSQWDPNSPTRTIVRTEHEPSKIWIDLGGLFRIHRVKIWNSRHTDRSHFIGVHVYAGSRLLGVGTKAEFIYDYKISKDDPLYARSVILHQTHDQYLGVLEVQVWGTGPYSEDDKFA